MTLKQYFTGRADIKLLMIALIAILLMSIVPVLIKWISANEVTLGLLD